MPLKKKIIYTLSFITILLVLYCYNPFPLYFQNDDFIHIPLSAQGKLLQQNTFRPICDLSIMLDYTIWGKNAWGYHLNNLLLHIIACIIFYYLLLQLLTLYKTGTENKLISWLATVLFFVYAMHSEPVLWILGRSAILATIFSLLFLICFIKRNKSSFAFVSCLVWWIVALLTYESTWILPAICCIISFISIRQQQSTLKKELFFIVPIIIILVIHLIIRGYFIHEVTGNYESSFLLNGDYTLLIKHYTLLFIRSFIPAFINHWVLLLLFALVTIYIAYLFLKKNLKAPLLVFTCFLLSLLPYISLGVDTNGTESERFLYFPTLVACILFSFVFANTNNNKTLWLFPLLYILHVTTLFIVKENYRIAGSVTKQIAEVLANTNGHKVIVATEVPQAQNGAFILRQGLSGMIDWLSEKNPDTVIVCSQRYELLPLKYPYKILEEPNGSVNCNNQTIHASPDTLLLRFTDSALIISKTK